MSTSSQPAAVSTSSQPAATGLAATGRAEARVASVAVDAADAAVALVPAGLAGPISAAHGHHLEGLAVAAYGQHLEDCFRLCETKVPFGAEAAARCAADKAAADKAAADKAAFDDHFRPGYDGEDAHSRGEYTRVSELIAALNSVLAAKGDLLLTAMRDADHVLWLPSFRAEGVRLNIMTGTRHADGTIAELDYKGAAAEPMLQFDGDE